MLPSGVCRATTKAVALVTETFSKIQANVLINDLDNKVRLLNPGHDAEFTELYFTSSLYAANHVVDDQSAVPKIRVPVGALDNVAEVSTHLIKIDVVGFELSVFAEAKQVSPSPEVKALVVELNDSGTCVGHSRKDLVEYLKSCSFKCYLYDPMQRLLTSAAPCSKLVGNALFLRDQAFVEKRIRQSLQYLVRRIEVSLFLACLMSHLRA